MAITKEQALDILDRLDMFQGQRAGRELWNDKPLDVQNQDIADFSRDVALLKEYINQADVVTKREVVSEILAKVKEWLYQIAINNVGCALKGDFSKACEEIISRLDGLERFIMETR